MEIIQAIHTRRSIRKYTDDPVEDQVVDEVLRAGMMAPSAGNEQPWHFVILRNPATLQAIARAHPYASMAEHAPVAILVCGDISLDKYDGFWAQDCAAAMQNMLLAIHAFGLGGVWVGIHPRPQRLADIRRAIALPDHIIPFALLPFGYPDEEKPRENRFQTARVHRERW